MSDHVPILVIYLVPWAICVWTMYMMITTSLKHEGISFAWLLGSFIWQRRNREHLLIFLTFVCLEIAFLAWPLMGWLKLR
jgi:hypothetical protein